MRKFTVHILAIVLACTICIAATKDPIQESLDQAKAEFTAIADKATKALSSAFDKQIASVSQTGELDAVETLRRQRNAFLISQKMPSAPSMDTAAAEYRETIVSANSNLCKAYDTAISGYTKAQQFDDAERVTHMKAERFPANPQNPAQAGAAVAPTDPILTSVKQSKQDFIDTVKAAHADVIAVINARATVEADRGNLEGYKSLTDLCAKVKVDIVVPDDVKDTEIRNSSAKFLNIAEKAYGKLRVSYQNAVVDYTKARRIDEAEAVQAELADGGWFECYTGTPEQQKVAKIRFTEHMGYTVGTLARGERTHNNDVNTYQDIPDSLAGKNYTLCVAAGKGHVRIHFLTSGKMYLLQSSWAVKSDLDELAKLGHKETTIPSLTTSGREVFQVWSITGKAGADMDINFPVPLIAESLEKTKP